MKKLITILAVMLMLGFTLGTAAVWAEPSDAEPSGNEGYGYTVTVYAGLQGTYKGKTTDSKNYKPGELVTISLDDVVVTNNKYYAIGFRVTGHDNDEAPESAQITFNASTDVAYEVAYGIKGDLVAYKVNYQDASGKTLSKSNTYYGMIGDEPAVSFKYIEGYLPDAYNKSKTLTENPANNVFTFTYTKSGEGGNGENGENGNGQNGNGGNGANGGNAGNAGGAIAPGTAGNPAGANVAQGGNTTIGDNSVPLANPDQPSQYEDLDEEGLGALLWVLIVIGAVALGSILLLLRWIMKKREGEEAEAGAGDDEM